MSDFDDLDPIEMTEEQLYALPEYSLTLPTGTAEGKRWRRLVVPTLSESRWAIGQYLAPDGDRVPIRWRRAVIVT